MSENSSKPTVRQRLRNVAAVLALPIWTVGSVFFIGGLIAELIISTAAAQLGVKGALSSSLFIMIQSVAVYVCGLGILLIEPYAIRGLSWAEVRRLLGIQRLPNGRDFGAACLGWAGYFVATALVAIAVMAIFPSFNGDQAQPIGFDLQGGPLDKVYAFIVIVIVAPLVEEIVFRGYLQGNLRRFMPWWLSALITSLLFGAVHGQWNVGLDVFIMSMVACYMRERSGALWAGVGIHMIKNFVAYSILFLSPQWLLKMLGV